MGHLARALLIIALCALSIQCLNNGWHGLMMLAMLGQVIVAASVGVR